MNKAEAIHNLERVARWCSNWDAKSLYASEPWVTQWGQDERSPTMVMRDVIDWLKGEKNG